MAQRPDVAVIVPALDIGGTERHLLAVLPEVRAAGINVTVFLLDGYGALAPLMRESGVAVTAAPRDAPLVRRVASLWRWLRTTQPRLVHYFLPKAYLLGSLCTPSGMPAILSRRSLNRYQQRRPWARVLEQCAHRRLRLALGNAEAIRAELIDEGIAPAAVRVIYNGVTMPVPTTPTSRADARAALALDADELVFVMVANLLPYKGHADVIAAMSELESILEQPWRILFVGADRGIGEALTNAVRRAGLTARTHWCGMVDDIEPYLRAADVAVLASHEEGLSSFILEAMAAGLPVVATAVGGNCEALRDRVDGILVAPQAPVALAAALRELAEDKVLRQRYGAAARVRVVESFSSQSCVQGYLAAYREVLGTGGDVV